MTDTKRKSVTHKQPTNELDGNNRKETEPTLKRYKSLLVCVVCSGDAHGYNFDAITCESCKAFFRRNAQRPVQKFKCSSGGHCDVTVNVKKRCKRCRLQKCLASGMRKEWILSELEKKEKRNKIEENRQLRLLNDSSHPDLKLAIELDPKVASDLIAILNDPIVSELDWFTIQYIQTCFTEAVKLNIISGISAYPSTHHVGSTTELLRVPFYISAMRLITYMRQIDEFKQLDQIDQIHLIRLNVLTMCFFHSIFMYDPRTDNYHEQDTKDPLFAGKEWIKTFNHDFHRQMKSLRNNLLSIFQSDDIIIRLVLLILFFSQQLSSDQSSQHSVNNVQTRIIFQQQNVFTTLLYKYCLNQYGFRQATILFSRYIHELMRLQKLIDGIKFNIENYIEIENLPPLMQTLFL